MKPEQSTEVLRMTKLRRLIAQNESFLNDLEQARAHFEKVLEPSITSPCTRKAHLRTRRSSICLNPEEQTTFAGQ